MEPGVALQAVLTGLSQGAVYGLVGLGFTLVYRLTRVLSFAHGDVVTTSVFVALLATVGTTPVVAAPTAVVAVSQLLLAVGVGVALSVLGYAAAVRPFERLGSAVSAVTATAVGWVAATLAGGLLLREALRLVFTREAYAVADPLRLDRLVGEAGFVRLPGGQTMPARAVGVLVIALAAAAVVERVVVATRTGRAMRAVADDRDTAALMGIPATRVVVLAFAVAGGLAGLAGILVAPAGRISIGAGVVLGLKGTAAALLGRLGSVRGAVAGGLALGVVESVAVASEAFGPAYVDVLPLALLVAVIAVRPEGLRARHVTVVE